MKVFIADDSSAVVERLVYLLDDVPGVQLAGQASNVPEAIRSIQRIKPEVVILDLHMPGGTGLDVLHAIRSDHPSPFVLICTNYPDSEYREECLNAGAKFFLDKSSEFEKIPAILRELTHREAKPLPAGR